MNPFSVSGSPTQKKMGLTAQPSIIRNESNKISPSARCPLVLCALLLLPPFPSLFFSSPTFLLCFSDPLSFPASPPNLADSPAGLGDDHFCPHFVEFQPQLSFVEEHLDPFHALGEGEKKKGQATSSGWPFLASLSSPKSPQMQRIFLPLKPESHQACHH